MFRSDSLLQDWRAWLAGICALTLLAYGAALDNFFIPFDDNTLIYLNPAVEHFSFATIKYIFTSYDPELYIPLTFLVYQFMHLAFGFTPAAYHALSLVLHLLNIGLVVWIMWQLTHKRAVALIVGLLFAIHPMQSETVLWAAALKDVLSSSFGLLSLGLYARYRSTASRTLFRWCVACFLLGLLAKVSIAPLPLIFLLLDRLEGRHFDRSSWLEKWPFFVLAAVFVIIALMGKTAGIGSAGVVTTLLLSFKAIAFYMLKLAWPSHLSLLYPQLIHPVITSPVIVLSIAATILLFVVAFLTRNRFPFVTVGILWFVIFLVPSFSNFYKNEYLYFASNRYVYLAYIGLFFIIAEASVSLGEKKPKVQIPLAVLLVSASALFAFITHQQVNIWNNAKSLFLNVITHYPTSVVAYNNYGAEFIGTETAYENYKKALALDPYFTLSYRNIANYYFAKGDMKNVEKTYEEAMDAIDKKPHPIDDDVTYIYFAYAQHLDDLGQGPRAVELFKKALSLAPDYSEAHYNLGVMYQKYGPRDLAEIELKTAVDMDGQNGDFLYHLAAIYGEKGQLQDATDLLERVVAIDPFYPQAQRHLDSLRGILK